MPESELRPPGPEQMFEMAIDPERMPAGRLRDRMLRAWRRTWTRMARLGGISDGNHIEFFFDGDDAFESMFSAIDHAQHRIWHETYIWEDDRIGRALRERLLSACLRGCEVVLLYDSWGSSALPDDFFHVLKEAGAQVIGFNPLRKMFNRSRPISVLMRDHRKILIVDDKIGFVGGMNVSEDYAGERLGRHVFRDTHARLHGPAVYHLGDVFLDGLRLGQRRKVVSDRQPPPARPNGALVQVLRSNVVTRRLHIQRALRQSVRRSISRCWLTSPYFLPPPRLMRQMVRAAKRGVEVRVLTAGQSDVPLVKMASRHLYARLLKGGVKLYELQNRALHAKTAVIDGIYSTVGSFNLDHWSYRRNLEVNVAMVDVGLAQQMEAQFQADLKDARPIALAEINQRSLWEQLLSWLAYQAARL